eukprot:366573-Chlamydomonas_euryale.AAC.47
MQTWDANFECTLETQTRNAPQKEDTDVSSGENEAQDKRRAWIKGSELEQLPPAATEQIVR